ncbi:MAG TPA: class I SAM-dependent methyltransferase [Clostridiaceae bacterium]|nr:class I SAM-dependent methyltransferase [Clostridiaceae bacterium]
MYDVDYSQWADYIEEIFRLNNVKPVLVLDLGCGTGSFCTEMAKRGYDMIGVDLSVDMLSVASAKAHENGFNILYINQDMTEFELYGTVDAVVCLMDSINYITKKTDLKKLFKNVENYLNPGGLFIFDVNSCYKIENILADNVFYSIDDEITYIWQNTYDKQKKLCTFDLTFFVREGELYKRYDEVHKERAYSINELRILIENSKMEIVSIYDGLSFSEANEKSERPFFVCRKPVK